MITLRFLYQHFTPLISTSCKFSSQTKRNSNVTCLRGRGFWFTNKRSRDVNKCARRIEDVTPHELAYIRSRPFAASQVL